MKSRKKRVFDYISEYPNATNDEIAQGLELNENSVKSYISQLKRDGFIQVTKNKNGRTIKTVNEFTSENISAATAEKIELKKEAYMKLLDRYMNDFDLTDDIDTHLKLGNSILRILDNL